MGRAKRKCPPPVEDEPGIVVPPNLDTGRILGIDPGSLKTGFGVLQHIKSEVFWIRSGIMQPPKGQHLLVRLGWLNKTFGEILDEIQPAVVALETSFVGRNMKTALILGQARGALITAATIRNLPVLEFSPAEVKLSIVGHGSASKQQMQGMIPQLIHGLKHDPSEDEADALGVALCCLHRKIREEWRDFASSREND